MTTGQSLEQLAAERRFTTLQCFDFHELDARLDQLGTDVACLLGRPVRINGYYASQWAHRGIKPHHDSHDLFVHQCDGERRWEVAREPPQPSEPAMLNAARFDELETQSWLLQPGDTLYIPRGFAHRTLLSKGLSEGQPSLHLSIGLYAR